jgi:hypothetical protein
LLTSADPSGLKARAVMGTVFVSDAAISNGKTVVERNSRML